MFFSLLRYVACITFGQTKTRCLQQLQWWPSKNWMTRVSCLQKPLYYSRAKPALLIVACTGLCWQQWKPKPLRPVYTGDFCRATSMQFLSRWSCNFNIARVNQLRFQRDFSAIYRAITCDLSPRFTKHGNFEQQFRYSAGAHVLFWFEFFILFRFASISFCFVSILFCFVLQLGKDLELNWSDWTGVTPIFISKKKENI